MSEKCETGPHDWVANKGVVSENGTSSTLSRWQRSQWPKLPRTDLGAAAP